MPGSARDLGAVFDAAHNEFAVARGVQLTSTPAGLSEPFLHCFRYRCVKSIRRRPL
jgi:hypothetical protein